MENDEILKEAILQAAIKRNKHKTTQWVENMIEERELLREYKTGTRTMRNLKDLHSEVTNWIARVNYEIDILNIKNFLDEN